MNRTRYNIVIISAVIIFIISFGKEAYSKPNLQWKSIFHNGTASNYLTDMCLGDSGNIYVAYLAEGYVLRKISPTGTLIWEREYSAGLGLISEPKFLRYDTNGFIYITGDDFGVEILKYDLNGNLIWLRRFDDGVGFNSVGGMVIDSAGNCYLGIGHSAGLFNTKHYSIVKYNPKGDSVWVRIISGSQYYGAVSDIILDRENNVIVTGVSNDLILHPTNSTRTVKLNGKTGEVIWNNFYFKPLIWNSAYGIALGCDKDNNVYVGATYSTFNKDGALLLKYSSSGNLIWTSLYYNLDSLCKIRDIVIDNSGNCYITGSETYLNRKMEDFYTNKIDSSGIILWNQKYGSSTVDATDIPNRVVLDDKNNVYVVGSEGSVLIGTQNYTSMTVIKYNNDGKEKWIIKYMNDSLRFSLGNILLIDKYSNLIIGGIGREGRGIYPNREFDITILNYSQISSISNNSVNVHSDYKLFQNYPNPFNPLTKIQIDIKTSGNVMLNIYDISGKKVENLVNKKLSQGNYSFVWNANKFSSGVYFYNLFVNEKLIDSKKMILMK
ncbi:MAG TPA: T9SS type A sorting domain-containing protein [Ignavibacteria bacterium]|nr:T9SS type A sorting domain-containing protein [Ignavibacteria bacterium]